MFENIEKNKKMILGAYKKIKSYYYYDKTILYNKVILAMWESSSQLFERRVNRLAEFMCTLEGDIDYGFLTPLLRSVDLIPMPKAFDDTAPEDIGILIQNSVPKKSTLSKVNFYIKAPVELLVLDAIWMILVGKIAYSQSAISTCAYANKPKLDQLYFDNENLLDGTDFDSNRLFVPYFKQYTAWRNTAFRKIESRYKKKKDSVLISLDLKSYYYSVTFDFDDLPRYLNDDARLTEIASLTRIIRQIYIDYTSEMQKYRGAIPANCQKGQCALPIGLHSSMLIANLYLYELDMAITEQVAPVFYGRYVDDILIVVDKPQDCEITVTSILHETLVRKEIIKPKGSKEYSVLIPNTAPNYLTLQANKIRCLYFDHNEPDALINLLCEASNIKVSMSEGMQMPDIGFSERSFDEQAYSLGERAGSLKVRDFLFSSNNYEATLFINDLIRASKNVDVSDSKHREFMVEQIGQILKFYNGRQAVEYRSAWINVFSLILINDQYEFFVKFYQQLLNSINEVIAGQLESIESPKSGIVLNRVKDALFEQLKIAASIAIAPLAIEETKAHIIAAIADSTKQIEVSAFSDIFENAKDIRNANLFNNHFSSFPLISYITATLDVNFSLIKARPQDIVYLAKNSDGILPLNERKIQLCPRFIHFDELCLLNFLTHFYEGGNPVSKHIDQLSDVFFKINNLQNAFPSLETNAEVCDGINLHQLSAPINTHKPLSGSLKIALASVWLDEMKDIQPVLKNPVHDLSPRKKQNLYKLLNEARKSNANMIVFPEYYLPIYWIEELYTFSRTNSIAIVCGLRYITNSQRAYNYMVVLQPFRANRFNYTIPLFREKNHYAPAEISALAAEHYECKDPESPSIHLIDWDGIKFSDLMCFELTNIEYRYLLRSKIDVLIVPELNKDTAYFSNIVESASRDLHCFVVQANTSKYGDSRITGPYNSLFKDIIKIKGGENNVLLIGTVNCAEIQQKRRDYPNELNEKKRAAWKGNKATHQDTRSVKGPPAGFYNRKEEHI